LPCLREVRGNTLDLATRLVVQAIFKRIVGIRGIALVDFNIVRRFIFLLIDGELYALLRAVDASDKIAYDRFEFAAFVLRYGVGNRDECIGCHCLCKKTSILTGKVTAGISCLNKSAQISPIFVREIFIENQLHTQNRNEKSFIKPPIFARLAPNAVLIAAVAVAEIVWSSPLFSVLGFEYSTLMGLALSFICGVRATMVARASLRKIDEQRPLGDLWHGFRADLALATIPLLVSIVSLIWVHNCAFWDGLLFYIEIAYPSAIIGGAFGAAFAMLFRTRRWAFVMYVFFWIITLMLSFLPGYSSPQLFTYGWQYGFFPGLVWDESLDLSNAYLAFRIENVLWVVFLLSIVFELHSDSPYSRRFILPGVLLLAIVVGFGSQDNFHITASHDALSQDLSIEKKVAEHCWIYYRPKTLTNEEIDEITRNVQWYLHDIKQRFALRGTWDPIHIYIYPTTESLYEHIGTRSASIAKPWLGEVHITKGNLQSLKHELTHVLMREHGSFPFYASWSTGLTEGAAMSVEPEYDGVYTLDEHAARILQLNYATGIKQVMAFTGFASNASSKSYVLAGSFSRFLLAKYGPKRFDKVYRSLEFREVYGKPIDSLEAEWKVWLRPLMTPLTPEDSAHFRYYYDRVAIIFNPCLRRIGKLERNARSAYDDKRYVDAESLYNSAVQEGGGIGPLVGECEALTQQQKISEAIVLMDTTESPIVRKQTAALDIQKGDLRVLMDSVSSADSSYRDAMAIKLSSGTFLSAYMHQIMANSDVSTWWRGYLYVSYIEMPHADELRKQYLDAMIADHKPSLGFDRVQFALNYIQALQEERLGHITRALEHDPFAQGLPDGLNFDSNDSLAVSIVALHFASIRSGQTGEWLCPIVFRNAATELANEIRAEWQWVTQAIAARRESGRPGHAKYR
jgi:hypothetical protein